MGKDVVEEVGNGCGFGEVGDGDAGLGVPSTVERSGSRSVPYEGTGGGVAGFTLEEVCARLRELDIIHAPLRSLGEAADSAASRDAGCFQEVADGWGGTFLTTAGPIRFPGGAPPTGRAAPRLGEHTREVLTAAGYDPAAIEQLLQDGTAV